MLPLFRDRVDKFDDDPDLGMYWSRSVSPAEAATLRAFVLASLENREATPNGTAVLGGIRMGERRLLGLLPPKERITAVVANDGMHLDLFWDHCTLGLLDTDHGFVLSLVADHATALGDPPEAFDSLMEYLAQN